MNVSSNPFYWFSKVKAELAAALGAGLVGITDVAAYFGGATTVQGALAQIGDRRALSDPQLSIALAALRRAPPSAKARMEARLSSVLGNQYAQSHWKNYSSVPGIVLGTHLNQDGSDSASGVLHILLPIAGEVGTWSFVADVDPGTTSGGNLAVYPLTCADPEAAGNTYTAGTAVVPVGTVYSSGPVAVVTGTGYWGLRILVNRAGGDALAVLKSLTITRPGGTTYTLLTDKLAEELEVSVTWVTTTRPASRLQKFTSGAVVRHVGVKTGKLSRALWCEPAAVAMTGTQALENTIKANAEAGVIANYAVNLAEAYARNGYERPVILCKPGAYAGFADAAAFFDVNNIRLGGDLHIYAPWGAAVFSGGAYAVQSVIRKSNAFIVNVYLWGIESGTDIPQAVLFNNGSAKGSNLIAYRCVMRAPAVPTATPREVWDVDDINLLAEECQAIGNGENNDGFNAHSSGHIQLVNCIADNNGDDGFSPHDLCTFEVWGGSYTNSGKGNITIAYGAQGFCVGASTSGATGTSPRVSPTNYGGFVCLGIDADTRATTLVCVDCTSDGDAIGFNACGRRSYLLAMESTAKNCTQYGAGNFSWVNASSQPGSPGRLVLADMAFSGNAANKLINNASRFQELATGSA